jgi:hypothetical protein
MQGSPYNPPGSPYAPARTTSNAEYEFDEGENAVLRDLAGSMSFVGTFNIIGGALLVLLGAIAVLGAGPVALVYIVQGIVNFLVGIWTRSGAAGFTRVVQTEGNDIANMMQALGELRRIYNLQKIVIIVTMVLVVLGIVGAVLLVMSGAPRRSSF